MKTIVRIISATLSLGLIGYIIVEYPFILGWFSLAILLIVASVIIPMFISALCIYIFTKRSWKHSWFDAWQWPYLNTSAEKEFKE